MKIAIFGAGSNGAYVGGALLASGADVLLIGCARMQDSVARHGLTLTDLNGRLKPVFESAGAARQPHQRGQNMAP